MRSVFTELIGLQALLLLASGCASVSAPPGEVHRSPDALLLVEHSLQEATDSERVEEEAPANSVMLFLGATDKEETDFSAALAYERVIVPILGLGLEIEASPSEREPVLLVPTATLHPAGGLYVLFAPGFEFEEAETLLLFRTGVGWEVELKDGWTVAAELNYDFVEHSEDAVVGGVVLGYRF